MEKSKDTILGTQKKLGMNKRRRTLYAMYGMILFLTRPVRCFWFAFGPPAYLLPYNRTVSTRHSLRRAYRILRDIDELRTDPAAERWLTMVLSTHIQDISKWK